MDNHCAGIACHFFDKHFSFKILQMISTQQKNPFKKQYFTGIQSIAENLFGEIQTILTKLLFQKLCSNKRKRNVCFYRCIVEKHIR